MAGAVCYTLSPAWSPHPPSWTLTSSSGQWSQLMAFIWTNSLSWLVSSTCHTIPCLLVYDWSFSPLWVSVTITVCTYVRLWASCRCLTQGVHPGMAEDINTHALASLLFLLFHKHLSISLGGALCTSPSVFFLLIPLFIIPLFSLLISVHACAKSLQSSSTLQPHGLHSPPGSSVCGISQARILERIAIPFCRGSSQPRDQTLYLLFLWHCQRICYCWATGEALLSA